MAKQLKPLPMYKTPPKTNREAWKRVYGLLKQGWCQGPLARSSSGRTSEPYSPRACQVCLYGAVIRGLCGRIYGEIACGARCSGRSGVIEFNEDKSTTHGDILSLVRSCAAKDGVKL